MNPQRVTAGLCALVGLYVLVGPGWALLAAGALLWMAPEPRRVSAFAKRTAAGMGRAWRWVASSRRRVAIAVTPSAIVVAAIGAALIGGAGVGLVVAAGGMSGVSLLAGWNA
jgi:hypothetical protein